MTGSQSHIVYDPEWAIESSGAGSFQIECVCGWLESGFDTASSARAAGFAHSTGSRPGVTTSPPDKERASESPRRWWQRR